MLSKKRWGYAVWVVSIGVFAVLHGLNLRADFPNYSPWWMDWAKYTDEGWYGNAAIRAHLFGSWYVLGDFNPAPAVPVWPFLEWVLFFVTGVTVEAARGLAVAFFFCNLVLSYLLLRERGPRWMALLAVTLLATNPFLYGFSRLAILEPMLTTLTLGMLSVAVRLPGLRRPVLASAAIGLLFTLAMLTKTTALFLLPALVWAMALPLWQMRKLAVRCVGAAAGAFVLCYGLWVAVVVRAGLLADYKFFFFVNKYPKPPEFWWPLVSLWWSLHGVLWVDHILAPLAGLVVAGAVVARRSARGRRLLLDPVFGASVLAVAGYILFMTMQNHPQPRYFAVVAVFCFFLVALGANALLGTEGAGTEPAVGQGIAERPRRRLGWAFLGLVLMAACVNGNWTLHYAAHPQYTFVNAALQLTRYMDEHPNGKRVLLSVSGDEITMVSHVPSLNDLFVTPCPAMNDLAGKVVYYEPGWYATWNTLDPGMLEDLHSRYWVEQVASFPAFDDKQRNLLVLFKLHPWQGGQVYDPADENLRVRFSQDKFDIPLE